MALSYTDCHAVDILEQYTAPAGVDVASGEMVRFDATTGKWALADASTATLSGNRQAMALHAAKAGQSLTAVFKGVMDVGDALSALNFDDPVYLSATAGKLEAASVAANEVQTVTLTGSPTGGTFTLTFDGQTTAGIAFDAAAVAVESALEALSNLAPADVAVVGSAGGPWTVTFGGAYANTDVPALTANAAGLTGGTSPGVTIGTSTPGVTGVTVGHVTPGWASGVTPDKLLRLNA